MASALTREQLLSLPATVDIETGGRAFGLGRSTAYMLARTGEFPCAIVRAGGSYRVITADLLRTLHLVPETGDAAGCPTTTAAPHERAPISHQG